MIRHPFVICALAGAFLGIVGSQAHAAPSGYIRGKFQFYQNQGHFCPPSSGRSCTGARYLQSQFNTYMGVSDARVFIINNANGAILGQGTTDQNGNFTVSWTSVPAVTSADVFLRTDHADGRFSLRRYNDTTRFFEIDGPRAIALTKGTTPSAPQQVGTYNVGSPTVPNIHFNIWDGAARTWYDSFQFWNPLFVGLTAVQIRLFTDSADCPTSCAVGTHTINLDDEAMFKPQARVMHEMGHIALQVTDGHRTVDYDEFSYDGLDGWTLDSPEFRSVAWEEGFATFMGDTALYWANAPAPHTCLGSPSMACPNGVFNTETSPSPAFCETDQDRFPITVTRLLRDYFDSTTEAGDTVVGSENILEAHQAYPECYDNHCDNEPFTGAGGDVDAADGRSAGDYEFNYDDWFGGDTSALRTLNCGIQ